MALSLDVLPVPLEMAADGVVRVRGTRIPLETVIGEFLDGARPEAIVEDFDTLDLADVYAVIGYYLKHRAEIDAYLRQQALDAQAVQRELEARFDPAGIRDRLL